MMTRPARSRAPWVLLAVSASLLLGACAPLLVGSVVATGVTVSDRRTTGAQLDDSRIESRAAARIADQLGDRGHVNISSYNRQVLLTGEVPADADKAAAEQAAGRIENVRSVSNELAVMANSTLSQRSSDVLVTSRVKGNLIDAKDINSSAFKVVTERGAVYLLGRVTLREADRATDLARRTAGVLKVVRLFEIISEEDLLEMQSPAASGSGSSPAVPDNVAGSGRPM
jgi:osmotically-inducible protein OsmY